MLRRGQSKRNASASGDQSDDDNFSKDSRRSRSRSPGPRRGVLSTTFSSSRGKKNQQGNGTANRFKISDRLDKVLEQKTPVAKHRSPDLVRLTKDYEDFKKNLRTLVTTSKAYLEATQQLDKTRMEVSYHLFASRFCRVPSFTYKNGARKFLFRCSIKYRYCPKIPLYTNMLENLWMRNL